jgi:hypothetical protein
MGKKKSEDTPKPPKPAKRAGRGKGKKVAVGLLVVGLLGGSGFVALDTHQAKQAAAADALPYATGTDVAARAYQAFRAQGVRLYEVDCPTVAEKDLGQVTTCSAEDENGAPVGITATTVEDPATLFTFQQA